MKQGGYAEDAVEAAIRYVKSFGYINDVEYARSFIDSRKERKSKKELYAALVQKGVSSEIVEQVFEEADYGEEDAKEKQKMMGYLMRKGFSYQDVRNVLQVCE